MEKKGYSMDIKNDGKGTHQSYECCITIEDVDKSCFYGYGENEIEAKEKCLDKFNKYVDEVNKARDEFNIDLTLSKAGTESYLNRMTMIFSDASDRMGLVIDIMKSKGYECKYGFNPMISPCSTFKRNDGVTVILGGMKPKDQLNVYYNGLTILRIKEYDFTNIEALEQLIDGLLYDPNIISVEIDKEE